MKLLRKFSNASLGVVRLRALYENGIRLGFGAMGEVTLSDGANISWDMSLGYDFVVTLEGNRTLDNPINVKVGQKGRLRVVQDGTGTRTLSFGTSYEFEGGIAPSISTTASAEDILYYDCISATRILIHFVGSIS